MNQPIQYTVAFLRKDSEFLMLNRNAPPLMGMWNGVGGKVESGETGDQAVKREIFEETGVKVQHVQDKGVCTWELAEGSTGGMYLYLSDLESTSYVSTPLSTDEGILDWKELQWILDTQNLAIPPNIRYFLPVMLTEPERYHHHFVIEEHKIISYEKTAIHSEEVSRS